MGTDRTRWLLVVIDASERFARHVWRYVSRSIEFGSPEKWGDMKTLTTDNGLGMFMWWRAKPDFEVSGRHWRASEKYEQRIVVLDRDGMPGPDFKRVFDKLEAKVGEDQIYVVSATKVGVDTENSVTLLPRTQATLETIKERLPRERRRTPKAKLQKPHILITGAGFEIRTESIGLPPTWKILGEMEEIRRADRKGFPVPEKIAEGYFRLINRVAKEQRLDEYWNLIFESEMRLVLKKMKRHSNDPSNVQRSVKVKAAQKEVGMRAAFRESLLKYDWGQLEQCLTAAKCGWHAWLTTNYTHFVDRAIARIANPKNESEGRWRIISKPAEAGIAELELSRAETAANGGNSTRERLLFRLHGDISDLHTMAIAGHDKDPLSPLNVRVESLGAIYEAAERYLVRSLIGAREVCWHIVGHSLADDRLLELLKRVLRVVGGKHYYRCVAPSKKDVLLQKRRLRAALVSVSEDRLRGFPMTAARYMARLGPDWQCRDPA